MGEGQDPLGQVEAVAVELNELGERGRRVPSDVGVVVKVVTKTSAAGKWKIDVAGTPTQADEAPVPSSQKRSYRTSAARTQVGSGSTVRPTADQRGESSSVVSSPAAKRAK